MAGEKQNGSESTAQRLGHSSEKHLPNFSLKWAEKGVEPRAAFYSPGLGTEAHQVTPRLVLGGYHERITVHNKQCKMA